MGTTGTATVVFTDLVDSTMMRSLLGDERADELRRRHDAALRDALAAHGGREVKHLGDGLMVAFSSAADAVATAVAMQQAVDRAGRAGAAGLPLRVRIGVSAGDVREEDGDLFGVPVVEASRLCAAAAGGEILVSEIVRLLAGTRGDFRYESRGGLQLKGLGDPVEAHAVPWEPVRGVGVPFPAALTSRSPISLIGRSAPVAGVRSAWDRTLGGERAVVLLAGEAGIGKTRLATEFARDVHGEGATVLLGRCDEGVAAPFKPWREALRHLVGALDDRTLTAWTGAGRADLATLVPEIRERLADVGDPAPADPETGQLRLFDAIHSFLGAAAAEAPVLVVLDDLHWSDTPSLLLLRHLSRVGPANLLLLGTYREDDVGRSHPLTGILADLRREQMLERVALRGLDAGATTEMIADWAGHAPGDEFAAAVHAETDGNPFFVEEVLAHLVETGAVFQQDGHWTSDRPIADLGIPDGVRDAVRRRLGRLPDESFRMLSAAAVIGREFELAVLADALEISEDDTLDALEPAVSALLIDELSGALGAFSFSHALVRSTLVEELVGIRRIRLHRRIGEAIEHHHQDDLDEQLDALAHHFGEAAARGDVDKAVDYLLAAGRRAQRHNAYESAVPAFERALTLLDAGPGDQTRRCDALAALAEAHAALFQDKEARTYALEAIELARELHRPDLVTRAATLDSLNLIDIGGTNEAFAALSEEAVATTEPGTPEWVHAAMYRVVVLLWSAPDANARAEAERLAADALAVSERVDDPEVRLRALLARATVLWGQPGAPELRVVTDEMATVATAMGNLRFTVNATFLGLLARLCLGDRDAFETGLADAERLVAVPFARAWRALAQTMVTLADGRFDDAEHELEAGESLGRENPNFTLGYFAQGAHLRAETGRARPKVLTFWGDLRPGLPALRLQAVLVQAERGRTDPRQLDDARAAWRDLSAQGYAVPLDFGRPIALRLAAEIAAHLDDRDAAAALHPMLADYDGQLLVAYTGTTVEGAAARALGQLEAVLGRDDEAAAHFEAALVLEERVGARALVARTRYWYARLLANRDRAGDADRADAMLAATLDDAATTGMDSLHALARHERGLTGARAT